jgi:serine/threonine protein kinase
VDARKEDKLIDILKLPTGNIIVNKGQIGIGKFGKVYRFDDEKNNKSYAVKIPLDKEKFSLVSEQYPMNKKFYPEDTFLDEQNGMPILIMPFLGNQNMEAFIKSNLRPFISKSAMEIPIISDENKIHNYNLLLNALISWTDEIIRFRELGFAHRDGSFDNIMYDGRMARYVDLEKPIELKDSKNKNYLSDISYGLTSFETSLLQCDSLTLLSSSDIERLFHLVESSNKMIKTGIFTSDQIIEDIRSQSILLLNSKVPIDHLKKIITPFLPKNSLFLNLFKSAPKKLLIKLDELEIKGKKEISFHDLQLLLGGEKTIEGRLFGHSLKVCLSKNDKISEMIGKLSLEFYKPENRSVEKASQSPKHDKRS